MTQDSACWNILKRVHTFTLRAALIWWAQFFMSNIRASLETKFEFLKIRISKEENESRTFQIEWNCVACGTGHTEAVHS